MKAIRSGFTAICCAFVGVVSGGAASLVVHLPSTPVENASRRAAAIERLAEVITSGVPDLQIEPEIFRRFSDAQRFVAEHDDVAMVFSDAAWVVDLPPTFEPSHRVVIDGSSTYRRLLVARGAARTLGDLRGRRMVTVAAAGPGDADFLGRRIFGDEIDPARWFAEVRFLPDDSAAVTEILYGDADAGLVADFNPLLDQHLGQDLHTVFTSEALSAPVLSIDTRQLTTAQKTAFIEVLTRIDDERAILDGLGIDGFAPVDPTERESLTSLPTARRKRFERVAPRPYRLPPIPAPPIELLPLALELELPAPPSVAGDLLDSGDRGAGDGDGGDPDEHRD
ncbi:MAG: PhnD/SsuA/transferrin family substrate-binding protein [Acidobacteriota bacterium]